MKSSTGAYYVGLDHIRALAAYLVFSWHFIHIENGQLAEPLTFPLSIITEGHTGVAVFMTLSGYLFAKLLSDKEIIFRAFLLNRFLRLAPLLFVVLTFIGLQRYLTGQDIQAYAIRILQGVALPSWPNGGWSITIEAHFYILLPLLLFLKQKWRYALFVVLALFILLRTAIFLEQGHIQQLAYSTILGRIDQFLLGMTAWYSRDLFQKKHMLCAVILLLFLIIFYNFDATGGYFDPKGYPSQRAIWIFLPTFEAIAYATLIVWYDTSWSPKPSKVSRFFANIGTYSYSIYLLHFFFVFKLAAFINENIVSLKSPYMALLFSIPSFLLMIPIAYLSYRIIEKPWLRYRRKYVVMLEEPKTSSPPVNESTTPVRARR